MSIPTPALADKDSGWDQNRGQELLIQEHPPEDNGEHGDQVHELWGLVDRDAAQTEMEATTVFSQPGMARPGVLCINP